MTFRPYSKDQQLAGHTRRGDRLEEIDDAVRAAVWKEHKKCVVCEFYKYPAKDEITRRAPGDEWAHFHGRNLISEEDRANTHLSTRLCKTHHDWHHRRYKHGKKPMELVMELVGAIQKFYINGVLVCAYKPKRLPHPV